MGTWIEIVLRMENTVWTLVVPCNGNVDWNKIFILYSQFWQSRSLQWERGLKCSLPIWHKEPCLVVPCNGNVYWNSNILGYFNNRWVVPCNGNVDWNKMETLKNFIAELSFPAMGTWIEIWRAELEPCIWAVVPCNGNVDWNIPRLWAAILPMRCSHAGTWIEIKA